MENLPSGHSTMSSAIESAGNYYSWIYKKLKSFVGENVIEIGAGKGNMRNIIKNYVKNYVSADIDDIIIKEGIELNPEGNFIIADISSKNFPALVKEYMKFDFGIIINVLEHIKNEDNVLINFSRIIKPGGHIFIFVPAHQKLFSSMDKLAGHFRRYNKRYMKKLVLEHRDEFEIAQMEYFNPIGGFGWYVNKFFNHDSLNNN